MSSTFCFRSEIDGSELLSLIKASSKSEGRVTFCNELKLGTLICGTLMLPNGLTLLMASMAVLMAEFAEDTSFWMDVRKLLNVLERKLLNYNNSSKIL